MIKLASSPVPPVEVAGSCRTFLTNSIRIPVSGPYAKAPINAGKSDKSIRANDGDKGTGNSKKARIKEMAESTAVIVRIRTF